MFKESQDLRQVEPFELKGETIVDCYQDAHGYLIIRFASGKSIKIADTDKGIEILKTLNI